MRSDANKFASPTINKTKKKKKLVRRIIIQLKVIWLWEQTEDRKNENWGLLRKLCWNQMICKTKRTVGISKTYLEQACHHSCQGLALSLKFYHQILTASVAPYHCSRDFWGFILIASYLKSYFSRYFHSIKWKHYDYTQKRFTKNTVIFLTLLFERQKVEEKFLAKNEIWCLRQSTVLHLLKVVFLIFISLFGGKL